MIILCYVIDSICMITMCNVIDLTLCNVIDSISMITIWRQFVK